MEKKIPHRSFGALLFVGLMFILVSRQALPCGDELFNNYWYLETSKFLKEKYPHDRVLKPSSDKTLKDLGKIYDDLWDTSKTYSDLGIYGAKVLNSADDLKQLKDGVYAFVLFPKGNTLVLGKSHGLIGMGMKAKCAGEIRLATLESGARLIYHINNQSGNYKFSPSALIEVVDKLQELKLFDHRAELFHWSEAENSLVKLFPGT